MAMPVKNKLTFTLTPPKIGTEFLKYGFDRIEDLMKATDVKSNNLPRTITFDHLDQAVYDLVNLNDLKLVIDGVAVPNFYLSNERWGEFEKTWKFADSDKNVPTPYITIRRIEKAKGTRLGADLSMVPQQRRFTYRDVPILDEGEVIYLRFKMPQPINVDLKYEISLFTKYVVDVNRYDEIILKHFSSKQEYIFVNGSPMPLELDSIVEANTIENIDGDKFFISKYTVTLKAFIQNEKDFTINKTYRRPQIDVKLS